MPRTKTKVEDLLIAHYQTAPLPTVETLHGMLSALLRRRQPAKDAPVKRKTRRRSVVVAAPAAPPPGPPDKPAARASTRRVGRALRVGDPGLLDRVGEE